MALTSDAKPQTVLAPNGLATGGIRTPWIDIPTARTSGSGNGGSIMASLFGSGEPFDQQTLARLYPGGKVEYMKRFTAALDRAIKRGFILPADRPEILQMASVSFHGPD
jgi:hypothetical protein